MKVAEGVVGPEWIDYNDHVNMMWYTHLADTATMALLSTAGVTPDRMSFVAARLTTQHRRELRAGDRWEVCSGVIKVSAGLIAVAHKIMSRSKVAARSDLMIVPFDLKGRCRRQLTDEDIERVSTFVIDGLTELK